ncbi:MAG: SUV3 C-terminal domain-containing protein [Sulfurimonadaceae bacterium]|jgi:ATP-dependent RNA helicase SUPV3L1/SUV3|nr:SUV3 C-terminal domain-containing protein [Sulfurimonadaceae bacterium]
MAKKNKKITKINEKIRLYFDGDPFDVGIENLSSQKLSEMMHSLGIMDIEHNKKALVKLLRQLWSDGDIDQRQDILNFLKNDGMVYKSNISKEVNIDKEQKIDELLEELGATRHESTLIHEAFSDVRAKKITIEKIESKLAHIRFQAKKIELEKLLSGAFDLDDSFEFNASFHYTLYGEIFHKILTLSTKPYSYEFLQTTSIEELKIRLEDDMLVEIAQKQKNIELFIQTLQDPHPHLSHKEIIHALRSAPPKAKYKYPFLRPTLIEIIIAKELQINKLELHEQELLISLDDTIILPYSDMKFDYELELHLELNALLEEIWKGEALDFKGVLEAGKKEHRDVFLTDLDALVSQCGEYATLLHFTTQELYARVYEILLEFLPQNLHISSKTSGKVLKIFIDTVHEKLIKKQRETLLARTIRDFKNLFPLARNLRRKLILHIGPTNSGKTYQAMQKLQNADTGYYLAPLRLLALEGFETMRENGVGVSLITGEEQILDEDATHISSTIEMLSFDVDVDVCVIDEVQMIDDRDRGWAWANAIIGAPAKEVIMTGSSNAKGAIIALAEYLGEELEIIEFERMNPLHLLEHHTNPKDVEAATAIIAFSRKDVLRLKQNFSQFFDVSVVYGNLSPEVRREEARRFRAKETQILIATDAIAMGMNLPIKTILFSKADKFDGITQRNLFPTEVHQIAGRAGRYGLNEEGFVGALSSEVLSIVKKVYTKEDRIIETPFKVMANLEHIKLVNSILEEKSLYLILKFFVENMEFSGPFRATNLDDMQEAAQIVDNYDIDIAMKYHLACAPLTLKSPYIIGAFESYIAALEKKELVPFMPVMLSSEYAHTADELLRAEDMVKEISLYLWLSYRFKEYFLDAERAREHRGVLNKFIESSLQQSHFVPRCRICEATLPLNSKYAICQNCFKKNYTGKQARTPRIQRG